MPNFTLKPNLPTSDVECVIISHKNKKIINRVEELKIKPLLCYDNDSLSNSECFHSDMQVLHLQKESFLILKNSNKEFTNKLTKLNAKILYANQAVQYKYPENILLNCLIINNNLFGNLKYIDNKVIEYAQNNGLKLINVNQGYTKCSAAVVSDNAIITADKDICKKAKANYIDALLIRPGHIKLDGCNYGFIGGCSGKLSKSILAFTGAIEKHPDYDSIKSFALNHGVYLYSLDNAMLDDIGGILPITEKSGYFF